MAKESKDTIWINIRLPIKYTILVAVVTFGLDACYYLATKSWPDTLIFAAATGAAAGGILAAFYTGRILAYYLRLESFYREQQNLALDFQKKTKSLEFAERFDDARTLSLRNFIIHEKQCLAPADVVEKIESNDELLISLRKILALFEDSSIAIQMGIADEKALYLSIITLVINFFECFEEYIKKMRVEINDETIYLEFEKLYRTWKINKSILTGEKI